MPTLDLTSIEPRPEPRESASSAGLRYVSPDAPCMTRERRGRGFAYRDERGRRVTDPATLARIRALAIPPAWTDVRIACSPQAHVQATGRDQRGRKQYRYHPRWREVRDETKYARLLAFGLAVAKIRTRTRRDLAQRGLPRTKVLAAIVRLLEGTAVRIGNEEYARQNGSVGLTTMRDRHVRIRGGRLEFDFVGKAGVKHRVQLDDPRLARVVRRCQDLPGQELFQYVDESGERQRVTSDAVNAYLREISGLDLTAKDFRTWTGTVLTLRALREVGPREREREAKQAIALAIDAVAGVLGNTRSVCRASYVHPTVIDSYLDGSLFAAQERPSRPRARARRYSVDEIALLDLLESRAVTAARSRGARRRAA